MNKAQAIHKFWSGFGLPAYDENSVPDNAVMPYITYGVSTGALDDTIMLTGSLWYRSASWQGVSLKADEIARAVGKNGYKISVLDNGYLWITQGSPFAQRMSDQSDNMIRRIYLVLNAEFLTPY